MIGTCICDRSGGSSTILVELVKIQLKKNQQARTGTKWMPTLAPISGVAKESESRTPHKTKEPDERLEVNGA